MELLKKFDPFSVIITLIISPLLIYLIKIVVKYLKEWGRYALEGFLYWSSHAIKHSLAGAFSLKRYCRLQLAGNNQYLYVPSSVPISLETDKVYVPLALEQHGRNEKDFTHNDVLTAGNRIIIIGDPGSGKSSLVKRLLRDSCRSALKKPTKFKLPILFELKNLELTKINDDYSDGSFFYNLLKTHAADTSVYKMDECFDSYARTSGLLIFLDGLDEVSSEFYHKVKSIILTLSKKLYQTGANNSIVLTMRTQFYQQIKDHFNEEFPNVLSLKQFTPTDIYEFLTRWPFKSESSSNVMRIYNELTDRPTLREMCRNPLILSMYVAEDQAAGHTVAPDTRTEFYSKVIEELIIKRRLRQRGAIVARTTLREQRERILGNLAYEHLLNPIQSLNTLNWSDAIQYISRTLNCSENDAETKFRELAKDTGLITEEKFGESFRFIHLTFCEFLAANEAIQGRNDGWSQLLNVHKQFIETGKPYLKTRLIEAIPFACGLLPRVKRDQAINDVANLDDSLLLARSFLETKLYNNPNWFKFIKTESKALIKEPEDNWNEDWLNRLYLFNVVIKDAEQCAIHLPSTTKLLNLDDLFQELISKQQKSLQKILSAYAKQDAAATFRLAEICNIDLPTRFPEIVISNCDQRPFFALVQSYIIKNTNNMKFWISLLTESALRSRIVATWMHDQKPSAEILKIENQIPRKERWNYSAFWKDSFLIQCINIALKYGEFASHDGFLLYNLKKIINPARLHFIHISWFIVFSCGLAVFSVYAPMLFSSLKYPFFIFLSMFFMPYILMIIHMLRRNGFRRIYKTLILHRYIGKSDFDTLVSGPITRMLIGKKFLNVVLNLIKIRSSLS